MAFCGLNDLGMVVIVEGNRAWKVPLEEVLPALHRHTWSDWGEVSLEDWQANEHAAEHGGRLLSRYFTTNGRAFWIITEADRSATTILLPEEY